VLASIYYQKAFISK